MVESWQGLLDKVLKGYEQSYDVEGNLAEDNGIVARAHFHVSEGQHFFSRNVEMWSADSDEYVYFFHATELNDLLAEEIISTVLKEGQPHIEENHLSSRRLHMCTRLVAVVMADSITKEAERRFKKCRIYKNFHFALKGWMEVHTVAVNLDSKAVFSNRYGTDTAKYLRKVIREVNI